MANPPLTVGALFSGIGGLELGLERAGMKTCWQVEIDPYCQRVLAKHWPDVPRYGDIKEVDPRELERVDVICGGFPCQPVSKAGQHRAEADERWIWPEFARIVRGVRPRYVVIENVPGLLTASGGRAAQAVLGDLAELGFDAEWACIPAAAVGAPHLRYRVLLVAYPNDSGLQGPEPAERRFVFARSGLPTRREWPTEPSVGRVAYGVPSRVDRLRAIGNAVVPQVAEWVGHQIVDFDALLPQRT